MIRAEGRVRIARPAEEVFDFLADLHNEPTFTDASNIVKTTEGPIGLGTIYTETVKALGRFEVEIDRYERPTLLGFDARNSKAHIPVRYRLTAVGGETDVLTEVELHFRGPIRLLEPVMRPIVQRTYERKRGPMLKRAIEGSS